MQRRGAGGATPRTREKRQEIGESCAFGAGQCEARLDLRMKKQMFRYTKLMEKRKAARLRRCC